jgi:NADH dehydrogenase (ubiquinone) Fe-S protein 3
VSPVIPVPPIATDDIDSNFESLSPWEQVGDGTKGKRPDELKRVPPPKPEEVKK